ncbi:hypothetical protein GCM10025868_45760 [Angustibacter aerolatus]|uniref:Htaa domain-containing protein n=1 Tax=Angustibacter aerolatus TaxID=1162965 RepID=A0ABQ6JP22_9ACTN|nr:hypothetical protein [Angustibacter aerolatus]GMA89326.1 hypothetical protein GCM10025868_45760 [Angustibacter aerolatus]
MDENCPDPENGARTSVAALRAAGPGEETPPMLARRSRARRVLAAVTGATVAGLALLAAPGAAQAKETASNAHFAVTLNGRTYDAAAGEVRLKGVTPSGRITVRGANVGFTVDPATLGVYDYALTGAPVTGRMVTTPTTIFASKVPQATAAQTARPVVQEPAGARRRPGAGAGHRRRLGEGAGEGRPAGRHLPGRAGGLRRLGHHDAHPRRRALLLRELVHRQGQLRRRHRRRQPHRVGHRLARHAARQGQPAGRDEDLPGRHVHALAGDLGRPHGRRARRGRHRACRPVRRACTSRCQAQNRIRGSLPVPPNPTDPTPIGG